MKSTMKRKLNLILTITIIFLFAVISIEGERCVDFDKKPLYL